MKKYLITMLILTLFVLTLFIAYLIPEKEVSDNKPVGEKSSPIKLGAPCKADSDCEYLRKKEPCFQNGGVITLTPYCIDGACECRCGRDNKEKCD